MIDQFWIKQNETKNGTKAEIVCEIRKQLKLAASGHRSLESGQDWVPQATEGLQFS